MKQIARAIHLFIASSIVFLTLLIPIIALADESTPLAQVYKPIFCGDGTKLLNKNIRLPIKITKEMLTTDIFKKRTNNKN